LTCERLFKPVRLKKGRANGKAVTELVSYSAADAPL
jgi:hypothetical protein